MYYWVGTHGINIRQIQCEKEKYSDDEGTASEEDLNFIVDKDGFHQLA